jgi:thioesterase domain-containing protein
MGHPLIDSSTRSNGTPTPWDGEVFVFPATVGQQGFWYLDQLYPGNPAYNIAVRFRLQGPLDHAVLCRAINEIVRRHESLRTVVMDVDGQPVQIVAPSLSIPVPIVDLTNLPAADRVLRSEVVTVEEARRRFDLSNGPLIRSSLLRLDDQEHVLLVTVHHIVSDGWSIGVFTHELGAIYGAFYQGLDCPLDELPLQFGDFAVWQKKWLESSNLDQQISYWSDRLSNLPALAVATDRPRPPVQTSNGHIESIVLSRALTDDLQELSNREGVTFYMLSLAVLKVLLARVTGQSDIFVGTLVAGRSRVELEPLIGLFINPLVLRTDVAGDPTFVELLKRVRGTVVGALSNQDLPFERVVEAVQPKRDPSRHPVFVINFIYQRDFVRPLEVSGLTLTALPSRSPGAIYDLNFFMVERADGWRASCEYNTDLYDAATITSLLARFQALMHAVAAEPHRRISLLPMPTGADREAWMPANGRRDLRLNHNGWMPARHDDDPPTVAPRGDIEARMSALWEKLLDAKSISVTADFFDEGGHSLLAAKLLVQIERTFGRRITVATFLRAPTIRGVTKILGEEEDVDGKDKVVAIQPNGGRTPLFLVDGGPLFRPLAFRLGETQPLLGLMLPDLVEFPEQFTVKQISALLKAALRDRCPKGPYYLCGWSHAGVLAYEMAQQLRAEGEDVALLVLFDTSSPRYLRSFKGLKAFPIRFYLLAAKLLHHFSELRQLKPRKAIEYAWERVKTIHKSITMSVWKLWYRKIGHPASNHLNFTTSFRYHSVEDYEPLPCEIPIVLFRSQYLRVGRFRDPLLGWGELAVGGLTLHELPGNHAAMFSEPVVGQLAVKLAGHLDRSAPSNAAKVVSDSEDCPRRVGA